MKIKEQEQRCKEFLSCLGNGKTIFQCEAENDMIKINKKEGVKKK